MELSTQQTTNAALSLDSLLSYTWMSAETPVSQNSNVPICERRSESRPSFDSPLIAETGISHNITRILNGHQQPIKDVSDTVRERSRAARYSPYDVAYTSSSKQARHERCQSTDAVETEMSAATGINEHRGTPNTSDCSMSSFESLSPISSSSTADTASPTENGSDSSQTDADLAASPDNKSDQKKKLSRTNYTKEQLKTLMKIFHENPYPDSEMMDNKVYWQSGILPLAKNIYTIEIWPRQGIMQ